MSQKIHSYPLTWQSSFIISLIKYQPQSNMKTTALQQITYSCYAIRWCQLHSCRAFSFESSCIQFACSNNNQQSGTKHILLSGKKERKRSTHDNSWKAAPGLGLNAIAVTAPVCPLSTETGIPSGIRHCIGKSSYGR